MRYFTFLFGGSALSQYLCCRNHDVKQYVSSHTVDGEFVQVPLAQITWYHHISMFPKVKDNILRAFYITESAFRRGRL